MSQDRVEYTGSVYQVGDYMTVATEYFKAGDQVVRVSGRSRNMETVEKVWKNGVIIVGRNKFEAVPVNKDWSKETVPGVNAWTVSEEVKAYGYGHTSGYIRRPKDGETQEQFDAEAEAMREEKRQEKQAQEDKYAASLEAAYGRFEDLILTSAVGQISADLQVHSFQYKPTQGWDAERGYVYVVSYWLLETVEEETDYDKYHADIEADLHRADDYEVPVKTSPLFRCFYSYHSIDPKEGRFISSSASDTQGATVKEAIAGMCYRLKA